MYRIAICDDEAQTRRFLRRSVEDGEISCAVDEFSDGMELLGCDTQYDILFLDIDMPQMNGIETAERISGLYEPFFCGTSIFLFDQACSEGGDYPAGQGGASLQRSRG